MQRYLDSTECINWKHPKVKAQASRIANNASGSVDIAQRCFEFVRDEIRHSGDFQLNPVTCKAEDVLEHGTGYCYAKSHLLAALLRANEIPAGLCYQRLAITDSAQFCLHGLNAIYLQGVGWHRVDARGNKQGVSAQFCPPREKLAFAATVKGEVDLSGIWAEPLPLVVQALNQYHSYQEMDKNLPDVAIDAIKTLIDSDLVKIEILVLPD